MITNSIIAWGDQLGAQMTTFAALYFIAEETGSDLCFYKEFKEFRRGFAILNNFDIPSTTGTGNKICFKRRLWIPLPELYCLQFKGKYRSVANYKRIYKDKIKNSLDLWFYRFVTMLFYPDFKKLYGKNGVNCDKKILELIQPNKNFDIKSGYGTYQDWKKYNYDILNFFSFKKEIRETAECIYNKLNVSKETVSIHFRKGDYLLLSSLNLGLDYYQKALQFFDNKRYSLVIFSDDIDACKDTGIFDNYEVVYMNPNSAGVDMCVMSLCKNNIIANSSYSFWGAFLNRNIHKRVVCPKDFIGKSAPEYLYINGNYYPEEWTAL